MNTTCLRLLALLAATVPASEAAAERLTQRAEPGFHVAFARSQGPASIQGQVPGGESVQDWSRMITTQRFAGAIAVGLSPQTMLDRLAALWPSSCPGGGMTPFALRGGDANAVSARFDCALLSGTGKPETMFFRAVAGATDLHIVQVAFRSVPTPEQVAWARAHLESVSLVDGD